jgi:hypothetical protein
LLLAERAKEQMAMVDEVGHQDVEVNGAVDAFAQSSAAWRSAPSAVTLTQQEWTAMGDHAQDGIAKNMLPVAFGLLLEPLNDADKAYMKGHLPTPIRLLFPLLIQRPWNKYAQRLRYGV